MQFCGIIAPFNILKLFKQLTKYPFAISDKEDAEEKDLKKTMNYLYLLFSEMVILHELGHAFFHLGNIGENIWGKELTIENIPHEINEFIAQLFVNILISNASNFRGVYLNLERESLLPRGAMRVLFFSFMTIQPFEYQTWIHHSSMKMDDFIKIIEKTRAGIIKSVTDIQSL